MTEAGYIHEGLPLKEQPADYYRTIADHYLKLLTETTTPRLTQYLREMIARCEARCISDYREERQRVRQCWAPGLAGCHAGAYEAGRSRGSIRRRGRCFRLGCSGIRGGARGERRVLVTDLPLE
jgi:hypothetical protein